MKFTIFILFAICIYLTFVIPVRANGTSLGIYPPIIQIDSRPPADIRAPLTIQNLGEDSVNLKIQLRPFMASDSEDGQIKYVSIEEANFEDPQLFDKLRIVDNSTEINEVSLAPKQKKDLILRINLPKDEPAGDYYFSIVFLTNPIESGQINSSQSLSGIASNVLLTVGPKNKPSGTIEEFSAPLLLEKGPVPFIVRVKNTTNHFISPHGEILVKDIFGQVVGRVDLAQTNILANTVRTIPSTDFLNGNMGDNVSALWSEKNILGIYKATLTLAISEQGPIYKRDLFIFAFPVTGVLITIVGLFLLTHVIRRIKSRI